MLQSSIRRKNWEHTTLGREEGERDNGDEEKTMHLAFLHGRCFLCREEDGAGAVDIAMVHWCKG
jgi:hypothetical protein